MHDAIYGCLFGLIQSKEIVQGLQIHYIAFMDSDPFLQHFFRKLLFQDHPHPLLHIRVAIGIIIIDDDMGVSLLDDTNNSYRSYEAESPRDKEMFDITHFITFFL